MRSQIDKLKDETLLVVDLRINEWAGNVPSTQTRVKLIDRLHHNNELQRSAILDQHLKGFEIPWWPASVARTGFPGPNTRETSVCQQFVDTMLASFTGGVALVVETGKTNATRVDILNVPVTDSDKRTVENVRLDAAFFDGAGKQSASKITFFGEVTRGGHDFTKAEQGNLLHLLMRVIMQQPLRRSLIGFLTDGRRFLFVRCTRNEQARLGHTFEASVEYAGVAGWRVSVTCSIVGRRVHDGPVLPLRFCLASWLPIHQTWGTTE
jgi:hypothetical protein